METAKLLAYTRVRIKQKTKFQREQTGFEIMPKNASGQLAAHAFARPATILALVLNRSSLVIPVLNKTNIQIDINKNVYQYLQYYQVS